jgi:hypothetical protein
VAPLLATAVQAADNSQALFRKVFGDAAILDPAMVAQVKAAPPGRRFYVDRDGDGRNDEVWFIDTSPRHTAAAQPVLVKVVDEDGDLDSYKGPDQDNDLYIADYHADGTVDAIIDYADKEGDQALHEVGTYFYMQHHPFFGDDVLRVWWGRDDGGDHLLWYDVNYNYYQDLCQYRSHFSGDETFVAFGLRADAKKWTSAYENPFLFWDPDKDLCSEVALRVEGRADQVKSIRWSFDADDDAYGKRTHDYDVSVTAIAEEGKPVKVAPGMLISTTLRGLPTQGWLSRDRALEFAGQAPWVKALLTWDEMNANTEENTARDPHERWEGVIAHGSQGFPQVGGPACSPLNKRNEIAPSPVRRPPDNGPARMRLYYDPTDRRLHLYGASDGWLHVDYNLDGTVDAGYQYVDDDGDGLFDRRAIDIDGDGTPDFVWPMNPKHVQFVELEWRQLAAFYKSSLSKAIQDSRAFIDAARTVMPELASDPVASYFVHDLADWMPQTQLGEYMRSSTGGARFYLDLIRDRAFAALKGRYGGRAAWANLEAGYAAGDYAIAADLLLSTLAGGAPVADTRPFGAFTRRVALRLNNAESPARPGWPIDLPLAHVRKVAADFNPDNCAVVAGERYVAWREIPHQVDGADANVGAELTFVADLPAADSATYYLYYAPKGKRDAVFPRRTGTAQDWVPPNIGWESQCGAYRAYWGQFDFFGKKTDQLVYDNIGTGNYHAEVAWGIDALDVGKTSGLGGLTMYVGGKPYLVQNPAGDGLVKFSKRQLAKGPVRAAIEITASNMVPDRPDIAIKLVCIIYAGRQESEIRAYVDGAKTGEIALAPGLVKLSRETAFSDLQAGYFGAWGWQNDAIGDIGLAVVLPAAPLGELADLPEERRVPCQVQNGKMRYWILGDWQRGRQFPVAPEVHGFEAEVGNLASLLHRDVTVSLGEVEVVK